MNDNKMAMGNEHQDIAAESMAAFDMSLNDIKDHAMRNNKIPAKLRQYMDMDNIADELDENELQQIAHIVCNGYDVDKSSRSVWEEIMHKSFELIKTDLIVKNTPWPEAANIKYPMITGACIQFNARIMPEIVKDDRVVKSRVTQLDNAQRKYYDRAERQSAHMSYQLLAQSNHWTSDTDKLMIMLPLLGTVFRKSFFDTIMGQPDTILCLPEEIVINDKAQSLDKAQRITHVLYMTSNQLIEGMKAGMYLDYALDDLTVELNADKQMELTESYTTDESPYTQKMYDYVHEVYEQHRWLDLDGDGYQEPYIVTVHKDSKKVLRIVARYDESSFEFNSKGEFVKINPEQYFIDYHFIPNPAGGFYSLGFGVLLMPMNETVNSILNQLLDAGTLANRQTGFIGSDLRLPKGDFTFRPGEWKQIPSAPGATIAQNIIPLPIKEPSQTLFALMQFLIESSKEITNVSDVMQGENPPPNQPAETTMAILEQGQQIYSSILSRIYESLRKEFTRLYMINRKFLDDEETFPMGEAMGIIKRQDYMAPNYGIYPVADPNLSSNMQRMMQAQALMQLVQFPMINVPEVLRNYLQVIKVKDPNQYLITQQPPPSLDDQLKQAQIKKTNMDCSKILMDSELKAIELSIDEMKVKAQTAYYGGQLAGQKVDSISKLVEMNKTSAPEEVKEATEEEETLTKGTQMQDMPLGAYQQLHDLEQGLGQQLSQEQQQQQQGSAVQEQAPIAGPQQPMTGIPPQG